MAITRTPIIDIAYPDDPNGSVWNDAWLQTLYDQIDAADAALPGFPGTSAPTTTGTQTALALPAGTGDLVIYANNATLLTVQGIAAGLSGQRLTIVSKGAGQIDFAHAHASGTALGKLALFATSGLTSLAAGVGVAVFQYDLTLTKWRLVSHEQGAWITPTFDAADFTASGSMTWTLAAGDVEVYRYWLKGRTLEVKWVLRTTTVGGTLSNTLYIKIPGGFSTANQDTNGYMYNDNAAGYLFSAAYCTSTLATKIHLYTAGFGSANWTASTNLTHVYGNIPIEVA